MDRGRGTEERLRYGLNGSQPDRERLFAQILQLAEAYANVRPRLPHGGPDGGRDLEAVHRDAGKTFGAVGFVNNACDHPGEARQIKQKFHSDLAAAQAASADLKSFVFATNVDLSPSQEDDLVDHAKKQGIHHVEIYDRERLRLTLDRPEAYGIRLEFLGVEMSKEEQVAFFKDYGQELQAAILGKLAPIQKAIDRLEFAAELQRPIRSCCFAVRFKRDLSRSDLLSPYAIVAEIFDGDDEDHDVRFVFGMTSFEQDEHRHDIDFSYPRGKAIYGPMNTFVTHEDRRVWTAYAQRVEALPVRRVHECERLWLRIFASANLASDIDSAAFIVNEYCIGDWNCRRFFVRPARRPPDLQDVQDTMPSIADSDWRLLKPSLTFRLSALALDSFPLLAHASARRADFLWESA